MTLLPHAIKHMQTCLVDSSTTTWDIWDKLDIIGMLESHSTRWWCYIGGASNIEEAGS